MAGLVRVIATALAAIATHFFVYWMGGAIVSLVLPLQLAFLLTTALSLLAAFLAGRHVWRALGSADAGIVRSITTGALLVGAIGFSAGFFGPMIFSPDANQGPMLGIFITGPLGFLAGGIGGAIRGRPASGR
ncbi:MAG: hypothetical protein JSR54_03555 [Proteobacteria bacterium]|nr:hypothetical protein [Pseudomonadota bacterium]